MATTLQVASLVAAVVAVFQQNGGVRVGAFMLAGLLLALGLISAVPRARRRSVRPTRAQRRDLTGYFGRVIKDFERELPLPTPRQGTSLQERLQDKAAYVALPYTATVAGTSRDLPRRAVRTLDGDPVDFLKGRLRNGESVIVIGDPGSGKTLVAALTFAALADEYLRTRGRSVLPVFIRLNTLQSSDDTGLDGVMALLPEAVRACGPRRVQRLLDRSAIAFVLDGLDELPSTLGSSRVSRRMPPEVARLLAHPAIVTCREAFHDVYVDADQALRGINVELLVQPFTYGDQVVPFVQKYCRTAERPHLCEATLEVLRSNDRLSETLARPLMLRMAVDVLVHELDHDRGFAPRMLLTGSDHMNAEIYDKYVESWIRREHGKAGNPVLHRFDKLNLVESIAWTIFRNPVKRDAGYGSFELTDLLIDRPSLVTVIEEWTARQPAGLAGSWTLPTILAEIEDRTFLIMSGRAGTYRFAHKSFFEYLLARHVYNRLSADGPSVEDLTTLLNAPFPDEVIDFLRELLYWCRIRADQLAARSRAETGLLTVLRDGDRSDRSIMARQQAANLLPIVASDRTRTYLRDQIVPSQHPFIRRAIAVGEALHHADASLLDDFVTEMGVDEVARSYHMGYNRIYYGDQPLSSTSFRDDGAADCTRFFRACLRHAELERYRYIRTMAFATVRLMLAQPNRRTLLRTVEEPALRQLLRACAHPDPELGPVYDRERRALAEVIERVLAGGAAPATRASEVQRIPPQELQREIDGVTTTSDEQ